MGCIHTNLCLIHVVHQRLPQDCKAIILQLKKISRVLKIQLRLQRSIMPRPVFVLPDILGVLTLLLQLLLWKYLRSNTLKK